MSQQIQFYEIAYSDISNPNLSIAVTDSAATDTGESIAFNMANRDLISGFMTTGSNDTGNTTISYTFGDTQSITNIFLVEMNFKDFTIDYWNGSAWANLETVTNNTETTVGYTMDISTSKIRVIITATQVADDEKKCLQMIMTKSVGQFSDWPVVDDTEHSLNKNSNILLSGKAIVTESIGAFSCTLSVKGWTNQADIDILESIIYARRGVIMYINSNDPTQFKFELRGFRKQDFYVVKPRNEYSNDLVEGIYANNPVITLDFVEVSAQ